MGRGGEGRMERGGERRMGRGSTTFLHHQHDIKGVASILRALYKATFMGIFLPPSLPLTVCLPHATHLSPPPSSPYSFPSHLSFMLLVAFLHLLSVSRQHFLSCCTIYLDSYLYFYPPPPPSPLDRGRAKRCS